MDDYWATKPVEEKEPEAEKAPEDEEKNAEWWSTLQINQNEFLKNRCVTLTNQRLLFFIWNLI